MYKTKTTVVTGKMSRKLSQSVDDLMDRGMGVLDAGMKVVRDVLKETENSEGVETTIRIRLTAKQIYDLAAKKTLTFKVDGTIIRLEAKKEE